MMITNRTDAILDLLDANAVSASLETALELGLFWLLEKGDLELLEISRALEIPENRCRNWLHLLHRADLLDIGPEGYAPSTFARRAILETYSQNSWALLAQEARERYSSFQDLSLHIQNSGSVLSVLGLDPSSYVEKMAENPERAQRFTRMIYEIHKPLAEMLVADLDMNGVDSLLDLGGGSGVMSIALLRRYPHLTAVVIDMPTVCAAGQEIATENGVGKRISYYPANFLQDELPTGFDMVLECDVNVYSEALFRKVRASLNSGGRYVIVDQFAPADGHAPPPRLVWALQNSLRDPAFAFPTVNQVQEQLSGAGFVQVTDHNLPLIHDTPEKYLRDMVVVEAQVGIISQTPPFQ